MSSSMFAPTVLRAAVHEWLQGDIPAFDVGGAVVGNKPVQATFFVKSSLVLAGFPFVEAIFYELGCVVTWTVPEGAVLAGSGARRIAAGTVTGPAARVLQGERTALEVLTRCSAVATYAARVVKAATDKNPNWKGKVAATRKTTPGAFRLVEKYGAIVGGADPHRYSLSTMVMLKDNHIDISGSITKAVAASRKLCGFSTKIEVECRSEADAIEACGAGADVVMLDNFSPEAAATAGKRIKARFPFVIVETSGGITVDSIAKYAADGIDIISVGSITHGPPPVDISMKIVAAPLKAKL